MPLDEFFELDVQRAIVLIWQLLTDTGSVLGATVRGWEFPISQIDLWQLTAAAMIVNLGRDEQDLVEPYLPFPKTEETLEVTDEERRKLAERLAQFSALPPKREEPKENK